MNFLWWSGFVCFIFSEVHLFYWTNELRGYKNNTVEYVNNQPAQGKGEYVFMVGPITVLDPVSDNAFGIHTDQPYLTRKVECYQWEEDREEKD